MDFGDKNRGETLSLAQQWVLHPANNLSRDAGLLERKPQAERHDAGSCSHKKLRLPKGAAGQVSVNAVKVWMVGKVLRFHAEAEVGSFCQLKVLM